MFAALAALLLSAASAPAPRLWLPGDVAAKDTAPAQGERVLALCGNALRWQQARIEGGAIDVGCNATVMLQNVPALSPGRVTPARIRHGEQVRASPSGSAFVKLELFKRSWRIERIRLASTGYRLALRTVGDDGPPVTLYEAQSTDAARWQLLWAGDLDGDRELDLLIEASDAADQSHVHLFLSKDAEEAVDEVATRRVRVPRPTP